MTSGNLPADLIDTLEQSVLRSAQFIAKFFAEGRAIEMEYKHDDSMVMNIDIQSQELMLSTLGSQLSIVAEENPESHRLIGEKSDYFLVDPLDGTASAKRFQGIQGGQVGFGPLGGLVIGGELVAASFVSLPLRTLFSARKGFGVRREVLDLAGKQQPRKYSEREALKPVMPRSLRECGVLFFPGSHGEVPIVERLRTGNVVENMYRFGGFASDCARLAAGSEQIQIQFSVKPWDFSATLFTREVGLQIVCDPLGKATPIDRWEIAAENPLIACPPLLVEELLSAVRP